MSGLVEFVFAAASTRSFVGARTHSNRLKSVNGRMIRPYWDCLKSPRSRSATDQMKAAVWEWFVVFNEDRPMFLRSDANINPQSFSGRLEQNEQPLTEYVVFEASTSTKGFQRL